VSDLALSDDDVEQRHRVAKQRASRARAGLHSDFADVIFAEKPDAQRVENRT
jgi:hypothetical protein